jgi:hypothetical protein
LGKKVVYTVNFGDYDNLRPVPHFNDWDFICFTDNPNIEVKGWRFKYVGNINDIVRRQREIKINSHEYFKEYDLIVYHDANFNLVVHPDDFIKFVKYKGGFMTSLHPSRSTMFQEANKIVELKKDSMDTVLKHVSQMFCKTNMPNEFGLFETGLIIRDNSLNTIKLNKQWFEFFAIGSHRDQLSLPFASYQTGIKIKTFTRSERNQCFNFEFHKRKT